jgi:Transposase DDE domain
MSPIGSIDPFMPSPDPRPKGDLPRWAPASPTHTEQRRAKYFEALRPLLEGLHDDATERDRAGNRKLHFDQYAALLMLYFFNPILTSLRSIQQASQLQKVQRRLGCARASLGSLSEAGAVFDPALLQELIGELGDHIAAVPTGGAQRGRLYVLDRGYAEYKLFQEIVDAQSGFVGRVRDNALWRVVESRRLSPEAKAAGVRSDHVVWLGGADTGADLKQPLRLIEVHAPRENGQVERLLLATNRMDLDAEGVALAYRCRWSVELFFRWFKCVLGCRHLLSENVMA